MPEKKNKGFVYIVGAGPGDPYLLTIKGLKALRKADVILYDRLVNQHILDFAKAEAEKIFVGKDPTKERFPQEEINKLLLKYALEGKTIVRLKGGDPYVFGRGSEEAQFLFEHKIPFEVIPGISAGLGASAYSGIPLTHRSVVTQVLFLTAHEDPTKNESQLELQNIAKLRFVTIVIYMGATNLAQLVEELIKNGMAPDRPAAIVENATTPRQRTFTGALFELPEIAQKNHLQPPLVTIISPCVKFSDTLNWFERKPLFGRRIVTTRALDQSKKLFAMLTEEGAEIVPFPVFSTRIIKVEDPWILLNIEQKFDWLLFTSSNGVRYFMENVKDNLFYSNLQKLNFAAIGEKTAEELAKYNFFVKFVPSRYNSTTFIEEFRKKFNLKKAKVLRVKGTFENDPISKFLKHECRRYETLDVYEIIKENPSKEQIDNLLGTKVDAIIFTASITVRYFFELLGERKAKSFLNRTKVFAIGPMTQEVLQKKGVKKVYTSFIHTLDGVVDLMRKTFLEEQK